MAGVVLYGPTGQPLAPSVPAIIEPTFQALRVVPKPFEYQWPGTLLGHYRAYGATSAVLFSANGNLLDFFFAPVSPVPNVYCVLTRLRAHVYDATAVTAQRLDPLVAIAARAYTAQAVTNATALTLSGNNVKTRTGMGSTIAKIGVANAAAGITGGTRTLDTTPFGMCPLSGATAISSLGTGSTWFDIYALQENGQHPMTFCGPAGPEGFVVQWGATALGTGTAIAAFEIEWAETLLF